MKRFKFGMMILAGPFFMTGCADIYEPKPTVMDITTGTMVSKTAALSHIFVRNTDVKNRVICTQPPPDAVFSQGNAADISIFSTSKGDSSGEEEESEEIEMAGRTPAILMAREMFYRACEFSQNYKLDKKEAMDLYNKTLNTVSTVWATEAANTTVTVGDTVTSTGTTTFQTTQSGAVIQAPKKDSKSKDDDNSNVW